MDVLDGILPAVKEKDNEQEYQEERRLYYVAMTRAEDELYLFHIQEKESSFNDEIIQKLLEEVISCSDMFSFLNKNLIGKQYFSSDQQTYRITAPCGEKNCFCKIRRVNMRSGN